MTDDHELAKAAVVARVSEIAAGTPSLTALYELDPVLTFNDLWHDARYRLREGWTTPEARAGWLAELMKPPPDESFWMHFFDRARGRGGRLVDAARAWRSLPADRMFRAHQYVANAVDGVAALHVTLLSDLDPVAAVEFVATRSSEYLIWPGVRMLDLGKNEQLVDQVLGRSTSRDAVLLALACTLEQQCTEARRQATALRWTHPTAEDTAAAEMSLGRLWNEEFPARHAAIVTNILGRGDAGAILGPWVRHLVRSADRAYDAEREPAPRLARIALDALQDCSDLELELERSMNPSAACVVARMIVANRHEGRLVEHWAEWVELIVAENDSLESCGDVAWAMAGDTLARLAEPAGAWRSLVTKLQPLLRRRARHGGWEHDDVAFPVVMSGVNAAARLAHAGKELWMQVFEFALRHFLVNQPPGNHRSFNLPAYVFAACPKVFLSKADIDASLSRLPLHDHVELARKQMAANTLDSRDHTTP